MDHPLLVPLGVVSRHSAITSSSSERRSRRAGAPSRERQPLPDILRDELARPLSAVTNPPPPADSSWMRSPSVTATRVNLESETVPNVSEKRRNRSSPGRWMKMPLLAPAWPPKMPWSVGPRAVEGR